MLRLIVRTEATSRVLALPQTAGTVGSSPEATLRLPYRGVSRHHARLEFRAGSPWLIDLASKNGLVVSGRRLPEVQLAPGLAVDLGDAQLELEDVLEADTVLALTLDLRSASAEALEARSSTSSVGGPSLGSSAANALHLLRDIGRRVAAGDAMAPTELLQRARTILGAETLACAACDTRGTISLSACDGQLPDSPRLQRLRAGRSNARSAGPSRDQGETLHWQRGVDGLDVWVERADDLLLFGLFDANAPDPPPWMLELLEYLADQLLAPAQGGPDPQRSPRTPAGRPSLVVPPGMVIGRSAAMATLLDDVRATISSRLDVLLIGETGTGKELFARMLHASGPTAAGPFIAINCAAIPAELLEAELFGVQARVATGVDARPGYFLRAEGGTLFLDEIGDLEERLQAKLLRVIQEREVLPLGGSRPRKINVRVISASNRDLAELSRVGRFRPDLYYRLRGLEFQLPPLRERREDIPALVLAFLERAALAYAKPIRGVSRRALDLLVSHDWPGNVRELANEIERAVLVCSADGVIEGRHIALRPASEPATTFSPVAEPAQATGTIAALASGSARPQPSPAPPGELDLRGRTDQLERQLITKAMQRTGGNKSRAARLLGITRNGLIAKLARLGLNVGEDD